MHSRRSLRTLQPLPLPMKNLINSFFVLCESDRKTHGSAFARPETNLCFCEKVRLNRLHRRQFFRVGCRNALHQQSIFMTFVPPGANQTIRAKLHPFKRCHVEKSGVRRLPRFFSHCKNPGKQPGPIPRRALRSPLLFKRDRACRQDRFPRGPGGGIRVLSGSAAETPAALRCRGCGPRS